MQYIDERNERVLCDTICYATEDPIIVASYINRLKEYFYPLNHGHLESLEAEVNAKLDAMADEAEKQAKVRTQAETEMILDYDERRVVWAKLLNLKKQNCKQ